MKLSGNKGSDWLVMSAIGKGVTVVRSDVID